MVSRRQRRSNSCNAHTRSGRTLPQAWTDPARGKEGHSGCDTKRSDRCDGAPWPNAPQMTRRVSLAVRPRLPQNPEANSWRRTGRTEKERWREKAGSPRSDTCYRRLRCIAIARCASESGDHPAGGMLEPGRGGPGDIAPCWACRCSRGWTWKRTPVHTLDWSSARHSFESPRREELDGEIGEAEGGRGGRVVVIVGGIGAGLDAGNWPTPGGETGQKGTHAAVTPCEVV
jgi:hypothetical protein